ncbi:hypothetical protein [Ruminococcus sp.]|uniref:hypothetical protein n=1 Tax=Ruminococcus sp. TaxID=41978 RepID=UPI003528B18E
MMNNTEVIDKNSIYKSVYEEIKNISDWCYDKDITGREVGSYIDGIVAVSERLLKEIDKKMEK